MATVPCSYRSKFTGKVILQTDLKQNVLIWFSDIKYVETFQCKWPQTVTKQSYIVLTCNVLHKTFPILMVTRYH